MNKIKIIFLICLIIPTLAKSQMQGIRSKQESAIDKMFWFIPQVQQDINFEVNLPDTFQTNRTYGFTLWLDSLGYISQIEYDKNSYNIAFIALPLIDLLKMYQPYSVKYIDENKKNRYIKLVFITIGFNENRKIRISGC